MKLRVPSIGSTTQVCGSPPAVTPSSSPSMPWAGSARDRIADHFLGTAVRRGHRVVVAPAFLVVDVDLRAKMWQDRSARRAGGRECEFGHFPIIHRDGHSTY